MSEYDDHVMDMAQEIITKINEMITHCSEKGMKPHPALHHAVSAVLARELAEIKEMMMLMQEKAISTLCMDMVRVKRHLGMDTCPKCGEHIPCEHYGVTEH